MARKTHGLGRGLDSLFSDTEEWDASSLRDIAIGDLDPNPDQPRQTFNDESISQLAESMKDQGVLQPLLVVPTEGGRYRIIAGERRYRAARKAELDTVPCIVRDIDVIQQMEIALIENLQREDLNAIDSARGIDALMKQYGYTQEKVGERLGMSRSAVANSQRLLSLPEEICALVRSGKLSAGHARALAGLNSNREEQIRLARKAVAEELSVRQMEQLASEANKVRKPRKKPEMPAELGELQEKIRSKTGLRSVLTGNINRGRIVLSYASREELERLNEVLDLINE